MNERMRCFPCDQAASCTGPKGVCGKNMATAALQDRLTGALIGLAHATDGNEHFMTESTDQVVWEGLAATAAACPPVDMLKELTNRVVEQKKILVPNCFYCANPCGRTNDYDLQRLWTEEDEDIRSLKSLILFGIRGLAAYVQSTDCLPDSETTKFLYKALSTVGIDSWTPAHLIPIALDVRRCAEKIHHAAGASAPLHANFAGAVACCDFLCALTSGTASAHRPAFLSEHIFESLVRAAAPASE